MSNLDITSRSQVVRWQMKDDWEISMRLRLRAAALVTSSAADDYLIGEVVQSRIVLGPPPPG